MAEIRSVVIGALDVAGWSGLEARRAHNPKVVGSNPAPATSVNTPFETTQAAYFLSKKPLLGHLQDTFLKTRF